MTDTNLRAVTQSPDRRRFMRNTGAATLSATAIALLGGCESMAAEQDSMSSADTAPGDVKILNTALGLEHTAIAAYELGAGSGLLKPTVKDLAVLFQSQHKDHADALAATVQKFGGDPVESKSLSEYAEALNASTLGNQKDVLVLAADLELGAANTYISVMPSLMHGGLPQVAAQIAADETMHWTVLAHALGYKLPQKAFSFG